MPTAIAPTHRTLQRAAEMRGAPRALSWAADGRATRPRQTQRTAHYRALRRSAFLGSNIYFVQKSILKCTPNTVLECAYLEVPRGCTPRHEGVFQPPLLPYLRRPYCESIPPPIPWNSKPGTIYVRVVFDLIMFYTPNPQLWSWDHLNLCTLPSVRYPTSTLQSVCLYSRSISNTNFHHQHNVMTDDSEQQFAAFYIQARGCASSGAEDASS